MDHGCGISKKRTMAVSEKKLTPTMYEWIIKPKTCDDKSKLLNIS